MFQVFRIVFSVISELNVNNKVLFCDIGMDSVAISLRCPELESHNFINDHRFRNVRFLRRKQFVVFPFIICQIGYFNIKSFSGKSLWIFEMLDC